MPSLPEATHRENFGLAWLLLCVAFCCHVTDEALTGFLAVYNPTVLAMRAQYAWFRMPTFEFGEWLIGLIFANVLFLALTPLAYRSARWLRPLAYFYASVMLLNGLGHTFFTILGHTVPAVQFPRPAPGFYSSPLLLVTSSYLLFRLRATRTPSKAGDQRPAMQKA
jgi:hypothetical protein